jgi:hypothetical protein
LRSPFDLMVNRADHSSWLADRHPPCPTTRPKRPSNGNKPGTAADFQPSDELVDPGTDRKWRHLPAPAPSPQRLSGYTDEVGQLRLGREWDLGEAGRRR